MQQERGQRVSVGDPAAPRSAAGTGGVRTEPVTVLATRRVRPGCTEAFEAHLARLREVFAAAPGSAGMAVVPPSGSGREYVVVYRFESAAALRAWRASAVRATIIRESASLSETTPNERDLTGMETWFTTAGSGVVRPPPRWKMWLLSACGIYPIISLVTIVFGPLLAALDPFARFAIITPVLSALMTWLVMPGLSRVFRHFLYS